MRSSPETRLVDAADAHRVAPAVLDTRLRSTPFLTGLRADARVLDPRLTAIVEDAAREAAQRAHVEGHDAGYAQGLAEGRAAGAREAEARRVADEQALAQALSRLDAVGGALARAAHDVETRLAPTYERLGTDLGDVVCDIVQALLARELETPRAHVVDAVRRVAAEAVRHAPLVLHLNPEDVATVTDAGIDLHALTGREVRVVADASVEVGGAVADSGARRIDAQLSVAVARLRAELAP